MGEDHILTVESLQKKIKKCRDLLVLEENLNKAEIQREMSLLLSKKYSHVKFFHIGNSMVNIHLSKSKKEIKVEYYPRINHIYIYHAGFKIISIENGEKEDYADAYCRLLDLEGINDQYVRYKLPKRVYSMCSGQIGTIKNIAKILRQKQAEYERTPIRKIKKNVFLVLGRWRDSDLSILGKDIVNIICRKSLGV